MTLANLLIGLLIAGLGGCLMYYSRYIVEIFGTMDRAEKNVGGTSKFFVLIGFGCIIMGFLFVFGVFDSAEVGSDTYNAGFSETVQ